jgi:hypothetical protein
MEIVANSIITFIFFIILFLIIEKIMLKGYTVTNVTFEGKVKAF